MIDMTTTLIDHDVLNLNAIKQVILEESGKCLAVRGQCQGRYATVLQVMKVALLPPIRATP